METTAVGRTDSALTRKDRRAPQQRRPLVFLNNSGVLEDNSTDLFSQRLVERLGIPALWAKLIAGLILGGRDGR